MLCLLCGRYRMLDWAYATTLSMDINSFIFTAVLMCCILLQVPTMSDMLSSLRHKRSNLLGVIYSWFLAKVLFVYLSITRIFVSLLSNIGLKLLPSRWLKRLSMFFLFTFAERFLGSFMDFSQWCVIVSFRHLPYPL